MRHGAFEQFVAVRLPALLAYAYTLTGNRPDAEDLVQEALVRTGVAWPRVRKHDDPEGYVRRTMWRLAINEWRRPIRTIAVAEIPEHSHEDTRLGRVESDLDVDRLLADLPPRMRAVLVLRYVDGLDDATIATALGCSRGTVRSQASRALDKVRQVLTGTTQTSGRATEVADEHG